MNKPNILHHESSAVRKPQLHLVSKAVENLYFTSEKENMQMVSCGCEVLNCVLGGGWPLGRFSNIVGDKSTGKTLLAIEAMANFRLTYPEGRVRYCETEAAYDEEYAEALGVDQSQVERAECSTVEELFDDMDTFIKEVGEDSQGLYVVDSLDALSDKAEQEAKITDSTYGTAKAKMLGQLFRRLVKKVKNSNVHVLIISQVRDNIGVTFGRKVKRSGGHAMDFYASQVLYLAHIEQLYRTVNKVKRAVGVRIKAKTDKNKIAPPFRECEFEIQFGYGIDDVTSNLDWLKEVGELGRIGLKETTMKGYKDKFDAAATAEKARMRTELAAAVREAWFSIERNFLPKAGKYQT